MWDFCIHTLGIDPENLYITCHNGSIDAGIARDDVTAELWKQLYESVGIEARISDTASETGMKPGEHIFFYEDKKNGWSRA